MTIRLRAWSIDCEEIGERDEPERFERPALDGQALQRLVEIGRRAEREVAAGGVAEQVDPFGRLGEREFHFGQHRARDELREPRRAERGQREAGQRLADAIELESAEGA